MVKAKAESELSNTCAYLWPRTAISGIWRRMRYDGMTPSKPSRRFVQSPSQKRVDFLLLAGDLFYENKPSRSMLVKAIEILHHHCLKGNPVPF
ncbi:hypothetical protein AHAS_Ahas14G0120800 [Arachis hypogaea]